MTLEGLVQRLRRWQFARRGVPVDRSCMIAGAVSLGVWPRVHPPGTIEIGLKCELGQGVELNPWGGRIRLGHRVLLGPYTVIYGHGGVEVGDDSLIAMHCCIVSSNHTVPGRFSRIRSKPDVLLPVKIGHDVWLGAGVKVLGGISIGDGCVVGAGAVVTKDLPPYSIAIGVPAKVVGQRS